jgi:L-threonylcarbamoyladenylate synthase
MAQIGTDIEFTAQLLSNAELVGIPTETVYGLAGNALDINAVSKIFEVKARPSFDPLIVHVASLEAAAPYVKEIPEVAYDLAKRYWPGPLTILLPRKPNIPDLVTSGLDRVAIRVPNHPLTLALLQALPFPLAAPSANPFGYISPTTAAHVNDQLGEKIPYILDGGPCSVGIESTIIGFEKEEMIVYRLGGMSLEELREEYPSLTVMKHSTSNPHAPGMLKSHYAPRKKVHFGNVKELLVKLGMENAAVITLSNKIEGIEQNRQVQLSSTGNLTEAASQLFAALRFLDNSSAQFIIAEAMPEIGLGRAINDRLNRASAQE